MHYTNPVRQLLTLGLLPLCTSGALAVTIYSNDFETTGFTNSFGNGITSISRDPTAGVGGSGAGVLDSDTTAITPGAFWQSAGQIYLSGAGTAVGNAGVTSASELTLTFDVFGTAGGTALQVYVESFQSPSRWDFNAIAIPQPGSFQSISITFSNATSVSGTPSLSSGDYQLNFLIGSDTEKGDWAEGVNQLRIDNVVLSANPIPEPSSVAVLAGLATLTLVATRRRARA
jgi:hypothetical protein